MLTYSNSKLENLCVHYIGKDEEILISDSTLQLKDIELKELLSTYFLSAFKDFQQYEFFHETDLKYNEIYAYCSEVFNQPTLLYKNSVSIAKHLGIVSKHPSIKSGELFVGFFSQLLFMNKLLDAIVITKSEIKKDFLLIDNFKNKVNIESYRGIDPNKVDKACIIFNTDKKHGYKVLLIDNLNKLTEAQYWKDSFLKLQPCKDDYHNTKQFLTLTKNYITSQFAKEFDITKADQIDLLNRSMNYFKSNETFDKKDFEQEVFFHPEMVESFRNFNDLIKQNNKIELSDSFDISPQAVKKQNTLFKSILKLDKNFHVYIHGNKELIEKGFDKEKNMNFYKIYFNNEQ